MLAVSEEYLQPSPPTPREKILNEFAIISGPGLETVGGGQLPPFAPPPVATPMKVLVNPTPRFLGCYRFFSILFFFCFSFFPLFFSV